ncbi:protein SMAX1-LIKE 7 isoform X2 [Ziziphus jujuba]|uniref:Protein SMAX1-LIKE 7 isoform X2 n=1 Tax=Ziziphus jujuba TaxID=326968 RepID=A0ABM3ICZ9_ZIZJJ|nr:protein SMAX1-LIKE 7 isoform X2 [Ziziphus jujuba]
MPTPVSVARQCLTSEAAHALDEAVAVARRRGHAQTTSLHAVSALLSLPSSALRDACARARNSAYSPRLQFKALELCLGVSLDRGTSTQLADDPPVSNSLMAAIKRSQANQRRQPENYHLYHQIPQQSSISCVKVELQHLILSILDDPVVSRVFGEAGFRSSEIKLAILRPFPQLLRYSRSQGPPMFLYNLTEYGTGSGRRGPVISFPGFPGFFCDGDENCRRIGEVLDRNKGRNPLLVGVCAYDALQSFTEALEKRKEGVLPVGLSGLNIISIEQDISRFVTEDFDEGSLNSRFSEVGLLAEQCLGPGLVVNFGDLKAFVGENGRGGTVSNVVEQLTKLMEDQVGKIWLIGAAASYESYLKFVNRFPAIEKEWDLQLLPITSPRSSMAESYPRSSLMESFVPFGGLFSAPSDLTLPMAASLGSSKELEGKTKDDRVVLNAKVAGLQKKWDNICQRLHHSQSLPEAKLFPTIVGFRSAENRKDGADNPGSNKADISSDETRCMNVNSCMPTGMDKISESQKSIPFSVVSKPKNRSVLSELWEKPSKDEDLESGGIRSPCSLSNSSVEDGSRTSPASATSVTTDLGLGISSSGCNKVKEPQNLKNMEHQRDISSRFSSNVDLVNGYISNHAAQPPLSSSPDNHEQVDPRDVKMLFRALFERVGWQWEAISVISQTIACHRRKSEKCHESSYKGNIWLNFIGPDRFGKRKIAVALAELLYGNRENFIDVDLSSQDQMVGSGSIFECQYINGYDVKFRGKTVVDYVACKLCKKSLAVVFLENVDKSDVLVQKSLSQAILTGKFPDSYGREVSVNNMIFVTTSTFSKGDNILDSRKEPSSYTEERILRAKGWPVKIKIEHAIGGISVSQNQMVTDTIREAVSSPILVNKRKLVGVNEFLEQQEISETPKRAHKTSTGHLDLNLPAEDDEVQQTDEGSSESDPASENSKAWLQQLFDKVDETVVFKQVDFNALAEKVLKEIKNGFHKFVPSECQLEIDSRVMEQLLAAAYLSDRYAEVKDWVDQVLSRGFAEMSKKYSLTACSIVKLVSCEGLCLEEEKAPRTLLPPRIIF